MTEDVAASARAQLDAWRDSDAAGVDPVRFRLIDALARRSAGHDGAVRQMLDARLAALVDSYREAVAQDAARRETAAATEQEATANPIGTLAGLVGYIKANTRAAGIASAPSAPAPRAAAPARAVRPEPEPELVDYFRDTWSRVSVSRQLRQSQAQLPGNAGPLNSDHLVHRALTLMHEVSPGYLEQFFSYVEAMAWLEQLHRGGAPAENEAVRATSAKKTTRARPRKAAG
ncbi:MULTISPECIES: DUF2894 domain-containing protein [Cupriavidus]|uniref:DUF2894 domain-containing protein n=1 Tax=Cupriavidus oxalaticus TaxID=96344 RepID=A0A4P7L710_9BURK|nr:DUF2894 domain-containing protein [Cupriavidus oxalaticus]MBF6988288.1 DUF2894 domain-containing protein [Cupriavidus sp. IK-TO18]QBY51005.1 DUF2894 domain-containing protein [Cupriavidus oxalaticus]